MYWRPTAVVAAFSSSASSSGSSLSSSQLLSPALFPASSSQTLDYSVQNELQSHELLDVQRGSRPPLCVLQRR